jgi:hypothetical protein
VGKYNKDAVEGVKKLVAEVSLCCTPATIAHRLMRCPVQKQTAISGSLESNAKAAAASLGFVPVKPAAHVAEAIDSSTNASKAAAEKGIKESGKLLTRGFSSTKSLVSLTTPVTSSSA